RGFVGDDLEVIGLAADDAAERDIAVEAAPAMLAGARRDRDGGGDLERAGHGHALEMRVGLLQRRGRAVGQRGGGVRIEARLDDQDVRLVAHERVSLPRMAWVPTMLRS